MVTPCLIVSLLVWLSTSSVVHAAGNAFFHFVNVPSKDTNKTYLLIDKVARFVPDKETVVTLECDPDIFPLLSEKELSHSYTLGEPVPLISFKTKGADDIMAAFIQRSTVFNGNIFRSIEKVGDYINPSISLFRGRLFFMSSRQMGLSGSQQKPPSHSIEYRWVNSSDHPFYTEGPYLGVHNEIEDINMMTRGQDPRFIVYNDTYIQVYFTSILHGLDHQRMGTSEIRYLEETKTINVTFINQELGPNQRESVLLGRHQKNWSPFIYNGETYLIQSLHPLRVLKVHHYGSPAMYVSIISDEMYEAITDIKGDLRGGSNAILIGDRYLSFYHTRTILPYNILTSYVFGAYTFSAAPPFKMLQMSLTPIMPEELYTGPWASRHIDYCAYPMHIFREDEHTLRMSFGFQDRYGMMAKLDIPTLLKSLVPVKSFNVTA